MTVLVTGSAGYIGKHVVDELLNRGMRVLAVDVQQQQERKNCVNLTANIFDDNFSINSLLNEPIDACIHLAWRNGFKHNDASHVDDLAFHYKFVKGLVEEGISNISVMGSMHEVGYWEGVIDANTPCNPRNLYAISKDTLRRLLFLLKDTEDFNLKWLRGFYIHGDDANSQSVFGKIAQAAADGQKTFPFTSGKNLYDFIDVDKLAEQIVSAALQTKYTGIINCCTGKPKSLACEVEDFIKKNNLNISLDYGAYPDRPYDSPGIWGDATIINKIMKEYRK